MLRIGNCVIRLSETTSTIEVARKLADEGAEHGTAVTADRQTAGRGRRGRTWMTLPGKSLAATIILRELPNADHLGLAGMTAALSVVRAAKAPLNLDLGTKWPNDVVAGSRKLAGTLAELHNDALLLSLGLNINGTETDLPADIRETATTLELLMGRPLDREAVTERVIEELDGCWQMLLSAPRELLRGWETLDITRGKDVVVTAANGRPMRGHAVGCDPCGRLLLRQADGSVLPVAAGDVTLRI